WILFPLIYCAAKKPQTEFKSVLCVYNHYTDQAKAYDFLCVFPVYWRCKDGANGYLIIPLVKTWKKTNDYEIFVRGILYIHKKTALSEWKLIGLFYYCNWKKDNSYVFTTLFPFYWSERSVGSTAKVDEWKFIL